MQILLPTPTGVKAIRTAGASAGLVTFCCLIDWVRSSNFISWLLYNQYAFCVQPLVKRSIRVVKVRYLLYRLWTLHSMERRGESQRGRGLRVRYNFCRRDRESRREAARQRGADLNRKRARGKAAGGESLDCREYIRDGIDAGIVCSGRTVPFFISQEETSCEIKNALHRHIPIYHI